MGKKHQRDREEKRERYASKIQRNSNKNKLIAAVVFAVIIAIIGYAVYEYPSVTVNTPGGPPNAGTLGDEHEHAGMLVKIFGDTFDFSQPSYQVKSPWIHFEGQNGDTVHRHASGVTLGYMFDSFAIGVTDECYVFPDGREFCTDDTYSLKFFINGETVPSITDYVVEEDDQVLISYGSETPEELQKQIQETADIVLDK